MKPNSCYTSKAIVSVAALCMVMVLSLLLTGCSYYQRLWRGSPVQYGAEGSDLALLIIDNGYGLYGYCDTSGKLIIKPQYDEARPFYEGLAAVKKGGMFGYIDKNGKTAIPFRYYDALNFHNGKAFVGTELVPYTEIFLLKCCIIDKNGKQLAETKYHYVGDYENGMIWARKDGEDFVMLDADYNVTADLNNASYGLSLAITSSGKYTFKNKAGKEAFTTEFVMAELFSDGMAAVVVDDSGLWGYIDTSGSVVIEPKYRTAAGFSEGLACARTEDNVWAIIDKMGHQVGTAYKAFDAAKSFQEGLCAVGRSKLQHESHNFDDETYDWGFIDTTGKLVIDFQYDLVTPFKNGIAQVLVDGKIGYIDKTGKYIWEPK